MEGYIFQGGFGFRRRKSSLLALDNTNFQFFFTCSGPFYLDLTVHFQKNSPAARLVLHFQKLILCKQKVIDKCCLMSMQLSNKPFYVLERQKFVSLRNIYPSRGVVGFYKGRILQGEDTNSDFRGGLR